jgi:hypothetical protein
MIPVRLGTTFSNDDDSEIKAANYAAMPLLRLSPERCISTLFTKGNGE